MTVTDPFGSTATQTFNLTVSPDTTAPSVELQLNPNPLGVNNQETFLVFGSDNVAVTSLSLTVNGTNLAIDRPQSKQPPFSFFFHLTRAAPGR